MKQPKNTYLKRNQWWKYAGESADNLHLPPSTLCGGRSCPLRRRRICLLASLFHNPLLGQFSKGH